VIRDDDAEARGWRTRETRGERLEERGSRREARGERLEERGSRREARGERLEERASSSS
jgi:hypothetical protein